MRAAVTGANGLLGAHVVRALEAAGHAATAVVRPRADLGGLSGVDVPLAHAELSSPSTLERAFERADVVVHCAALFSYLDADEADIVRAAVEGTRTVVDAAASVGVRRVVVTSSSVTCGSSVAAESRDETGGLGEEWVPPYFRAKVAQEAAARDAAAARGVELVLACPTVVVGGPDRRLVPSNAMLVRYLLDPLRTTFPGGCNVVGVRDAARGHVLLAERGVAGERYLLGGEDVSWRTLHTLVSELCGLDGPHVTASATAAWVAASAAEALARATGRPALATRAEARTVGRFHWYSSDRARALGYAPASARTALAAALSWLVPSPHVPRLVRDRLVLAEEVYAARELVPAPLPPLPPLAPAP